ncbi:MAG: c-type cytochrome [Helicobacteraceae bacterium]|jgi:cytochrome c553|nr:c-type cytochrome [Helicobacteraceae bacterium]
MKRLANAIACVLVGAVGLSALDYERFKTGEELFKRCIPCHGRYANEKPMGKDRDISRLDEKEISSKLSAYSLGRTTGAMEAQASLLDQDKIDALSIYIANMHAKYGEELFVLRCSGCHGKDASKSAFGKSGIISELDEKRTMEILSSYQNGVYAHGSTANTMKGRAVALSNQEVLELARYIDSIRKAKTQTPDDAPKN